MPNARKAKSLVVAGMLGLLASTWLAACPGDTSPDGSAVTACLAQCDQTLASCNVSCPDGACRVLCHSDADACRLDCQSVSQAGTGGGSSGAGSAGSDVAGTGGGHDAAACYSQCSEAISMCMLGCTDADCQSSCWTAFNHCNAQCAQ